MYILHVTAETAVSRLLRFEKKIKNKNFTRSEAISPLANTEDTAILFEYSLLKLSLHKPDQGLSADIQCELLTDHIQ